MNILNSNLTEKPSRPIRVMQFGEGNFLRAFVDYMLDVLNEKSDFNGSIVLVKPIAFGSIAQFAAQDSLYTVLLRGLRDGKEVVEQRVVTSVDHAVSCMDDYEAYSALAACETLRFIVSNTTEAGIVLDETDSFSLCPPNTYPGKLTKFLYERFVHFHGAPDKGLIILPVELIDNNGRELSRCVRALAASWQLGEYFLAWLDESCVFASTLVDRIVTGYPRDEEQEIFRQLGYEDHLLVTGEPFALWVIEADRDISAELPFEKAGLPVIFTTDHAPYKQRKVRILNGAHTSFVLASYLAGNDFVGQSMDDADVFSFMSHTIFDEVIPTLTLPEPELVAFANDVIERFRNPFIKHALLAISLNSVSKWRARCLPSFLGYLRLRGELPKHLTFSLAALLAFYQGTELRDGALIGHRGEETYRIQDDAFVLEFFRDHSALPAGELAALALAETRFWGTDLAALDGVTAAVTAYLSDIRTLGMRAAMQKHFA